MMFLVKPITNLPLIEFTNKNINIINYPSIGNRIHFDLPISLLRNHWRK